MKRTAFSLVLLQVVVFSFPIFAQTNAYHEQCLSFYKLENEKILSTADGGITWQSVTLAAKVNMVSWNKNNTKHVVAGSNGNGIYVSLNSGQSWMLRLRMPESFTIESLEFLADRPIILMRGISTNLQGGMQNENWRSVNGGMNWVQEVIGSGK